MRYWLGPLVPDEDTQPYLRAPDGSLGMIDMRSIPGHANQTSVFLCTPDALTLPGEYTLLGQGDLRDLKPAGAMRSAFTTILGIPSVSGDSLVEWLYDALTLRADPTGDTAVMPLMPTAERVMEIHLGGHSQVFARKFRLDMAEAVPVIEVMRRQYRQLRQQARAGKLGGRDRDGKFAPDAEFHRRALDAWGEKFRIDNPEDVFIPADLPKERRLKHATTYTESFNQADSTTLGPDLTWTETLNNAQTVSNQATPVTTGATTLARAEHDLSGSDNYTQGSLRYTAVSGLLASHVLCRFSSSANTGYEAQALFTNTTQQNLIRFYKVVAGAFTLLDTNKSATMNAATDYLVKVQASGSTMTSYVDGVGKHNFTDTAIAAGTRGGMGFYRSGSDVPSVDLFETGDVAAGGSIVGTLVRFKHLGNGGALLGGRLNG